MTRGTDGWPDGPRVVELRIADEPSAWASAGFAVDGDVAQVGTVAIRLVGRGGGDAQPVSGGDAKPVRNDAEPVSGGDAKPVRNDAEPVNGDAEQGDHKPRRGIVGWTLSGVAVVDGDLDGLPTEVAPAAAAAGPDRPTGSESTESSSTDPNSTESTDPTEPGQAIHPNGVTSIDHVVVLTPDLERTIEACAAAGLELKRIRETTSYGSPMRQAFFRLGPTILEVVSGDVGSGVPAAEAPATWFGLAVNAGDLDEAKALLGDALGEPKVAVQEGRRIATFRHKALGLSVAVAAMDDHAGR
ncbi:MAG: hypothetical protein U0P45_12850 [Acidimicrobiales bacterium]